MATTKTSSVNQRILALQDSLRAQFSNLDPRNPVLWPALPRYGLFLVVAVAVVILLWFIWLNGEDDILKESQQKEVQLREEYKTRLAKAINLDALRKQREQVLQYVTQLEKQLPSKAEMDALLSDINQAGLGRSLQFELFRPGAVVVRDYYAELPITIRVTGRFHDLGSFASDVAHLSRIVTLNNLAIMPGREGAVLTMDATAKTFRYLDKDEVAAQRKPAGTKQ
ncbi:MAG: type 4a pilus biogenesis protein PilO [Curvibacter sp.]|jgi:type IV pilus assembly protein PilO|nr:type 4a pilus biogenesis protein PilO [Curvibacter sp.]